MSSLDLLAQTYAARGGAEKGLAAVEEFASRRPPSAYLRYVTGVWQVRANHLALARDAFSEAMNMKPEFPAPGLLLAEMQIGDGNLRGAAKTLENVLAHNPDNLRAKFLTGLVADRNGNRMAAADVYREVIARDPTNSTALNNLAYILADTNPDEALKYVQAALELAPEDASAEDTLGWIYYQKQIYPMALTHFQKAVHKESTAVRKLHLGMAYSKLGEPALAQQNLLEAAKLDPAVLASAPAAK